MHVIKRVARVHSKLQVSDHLTRMNYLSLIAISFINISSTAAYNTVLSFGADALMTTCEASIRYILSRPSP